MKLLFLTLLDFKSFGEHNIYCDLLREFVKMGHEVYCISPTERRYGVATHLEEGGRLLKLKIGNTQKTNVLEKGISTLLIEPQFKAAIKQYFAGVKFDLILYSTPPITLTGAIKYVKKRDGAKTYLLLKDIFPQNAVDLGMMSKSGVKSVLYRYFRAKEKKLYALSDRIGCMSLENVDYLLKHNNGISPSAVEVCPNSIDVLRNDITDADKQALRQKYGLPLDKKIFVYGGNLGKPQCIPFIIECLKKAADIEDAHFLIVGSGTEYGKLLAFVEAEKPLNVKLMQSMPKDDYDRMIAACDVGLIFLDHRFTIPNFPSRLLAYMQAGLPVLACTDPNTDIGKTIADGGFGWWCESNSAPAFCDTVKIALTADLQGMSAKASEYLNDNYTVSHSYDIIMKEG